MGCIYKIKNLINGKVYIGQTILTPHKRYLKHKSLLKNNKHFNNYLQNSWNKHGEENFSFTIIEKTDDINVLNELEKKYIKLFGKNCYNIEKGGKNARPSQNTREKISKAKRGVKHTKEARKKMSKAHIGTKPSKKTREKISKARTGTKHSEKTIKKITETRKKYSKKNNKSGYYRVYKRYDNKKYKQGFIWVYIYPHEGKNKTLMSVNIEKLERKVKERGLEWIKY